MLRRVRKSRFARDAAVLQLGGLLNGAGQIVSTLLVAHVLGAHDQGQYFAAVALYGGLSLLVNIGWTQATVNQVAGAAARGNRERVTEWLAFLAKAYLALGVLLPVLGWLALPLVGRLIDGVEAATGGGGTADPSEVPELLRLAWLLTLTPLLELPRQLVAAALQGTRRMLLLAKLENGHELVRIFGVIAGAVLFFSPLGPVAGLLFGSGMGSLLALELYGQARRETAEGGQGPGSYPLPSFAAVLRAVPGVRIASGLPLALRIGVLRNMDMLTFEVLPPLVVRVFAGPAWVAYFKVATRIMNVPMMLMQGVSRTALPAMSELKGLRDMARFRRLWTQVTLGGGALIGGGVLLSLPLVPFVVRTFWPEEFWEPVPPLALILAVGFVPGAFCLALDTFYIVVDKLGVLIRVGLAMLVVAVLSTVLLSFWMPETGAAWAYSFTRLMILGNFVYVWLYFRRMRHGDGGAGERELRAAEAAEAPEASGG